MSLLPLASLTIALGLMVLSPTASAEDQKPQAASVPRYGRSCVVNNHVYRHNQVFTLGASRCIKYLCNDGSYDFVEEGCDAWNRCRPVGKIFDYKCRTYFCRATVVLGSYKRYEVLPLSAQKCQDSSGVCRRPGEYFHYVLNGRLKKQCSCRPGGLSITYYCYD